MNFSFSRVAVSATLLFVIPALLCAQQSATPGAAKSISVTLIKNVRVFDGKSPTLSARTDVLVRGNLIERIASGQSVPYGESNATVIEGNGRTLMPGLIDAHWHAMLVSPSMNVLLTANVGYLNLLAGQEAGETLMRGFTSVRDMAGDSFGLKRAIDEGLIPGPRIWPSGAMISQSSGHGDFRWPYEVPKAVDAPLSHGELLGAGIIADGVDQVLLRSREQLMLGASQLKLAAGGGG